MPDPNKVQQLREAGYQIILGCGECQHGRFSPHANFGQCMKRKYEHAKHGERPLSVHRAGRCGLFEVNEKKWADIERSGYTPFVTEE